MTRKRGVCSAAPDQSRGPELLPTPGRAARKRGPGQPRELALAATAQPWPDLSPLAPPRAFGKPGALEKQRKTPDPCTPAGLPVRPRPPPLGPAPLPRAAVIFRKSEIKDGWRSGPERLGRRSAGDVAPGEKRKTKKKKKIFFLKENTVPCSSTSAGPPMPSAARVARTPAPAGGERSRPLPPLVPGGARATDRPPPGVFQGCAPSPASWKSPQWGKERVGTPGVFLLKAAPGREEGSLGYKWGGGGYQ